MGATIEALHRLQEAETQLLALRDQINAKHRAVRGAKHRLQAIDESIAKKQAQLRQEQVEADRAELDRKAREAEITKLRETLNRVKTNKEYSALWTQINTTKADNAKLEEKVLKMYAAVDQVKESLRELQETRVKESERLASLTAAATEFEASVKDRLAALQARRQEAAADLPAKTVDMFDRVAGKHGGQALAVVQQVDRRRNEYVCDGCNMSLTLEQISVLHSRDEIQLCHNCGRILFLDEAAVIVRK